WVQAVWKRGGDVRGDAGRFQASDAGADPGLARAVRVEAEGDLLHAAPGERLNLPVGELCGHAGDDASIAAHLEQRGVQEPVDEDNLAVAHAARTVEAERGGLGSAPQREQLRHVLPGGLLRRITAVEGQRTPLLVRPERDDVALHPLPGRPAVVNRGG